MGTLDFELDLAPCGVLEFSLNGTITKINQTFINILSYNSKQQVVGQHIEVLFTIAGRVFYQTHFFPLIKLHGEAREIFFTLKCNDDRRIAVICNAAIKGAPDNQVVQCIFIPITERGKYEQELLAARRQAEEALEKNEALVEAKKLLEKHSILLDQKVSLLLQMNDDIGQFSKAVSHDLQEPIRKIAVFAEKVSIEAKDVLSAQTIQDLTKINNECKNFRTLIYNLDRYISLNTLSETIQTISTEQIIDTAFNAVLGRFKGVEATLETEAIPEIEAYPSQIELLLSCIFENSFKFRDTSKPLNIKITAAIVEQNIYRSTKDKYNYYNCLKLDIGDNGKGFEIAKSPDLFQLKKINANATSSLGFGLALCKKIVEIHYGKITATSAIDNGTTVSILLPVTSANPDS
jgi:sigma-B regulation protein RsbU (phosphoserine phosphatase)